MFNLSITYSGKVRAKEENYGEDRFAPLLQILMDTLKEILEYFGIIV